MIFPHEVLPKKEADLVAEYIRDKDAFIEKTPDLAIKALGLYNNYIQLITKRYIDICKMNNALEELVDLNIKPFGVYSNRGMPWTKETHERT